MSYGLYNINILKNVYIREEDAAPSVFDVLKLRKVSGAASLGVWAKQFGHLSVSIVLEKHSVLISL